MKEKYTLDEIKSIAKEFGIYDDINFDFMESMRYDVSAFRMELVRKIRFNLYALKRLEENGEDHIEVPSAIKEYYESQSNFEGWKGFSEIWDIKKEDPKEIYFRDFSVQEEWEATLRRVVPELPVDRIKRR